MDVDTISKKRPVEEGPFDIRADPKRQKGNAPSSSMSSDPRVPKEDWEIDFKDLVFDKAKDKPLGTGGYGSVYKAKLKTHGTHVAVKILKPGEILDEAEREDEIFRHEVQILKALRHPNVVQFIGASTARPNLCIVTEFVKLGSLWDVLRRKDIEINWPRIQSIAIDICAGLTYIHSMKMVHRDLKSQNVLINDGSFTAKLSDFGVSRVKRSDSTTMTAKGTSQWMAPEMIRRDKYTEKTDVYSLGVTLWELLSRDKPYGDYRGWDLERAIIHDGLRPTIPPYEGVVPSEYVELFKECWCHDQDKRPDLNIVIERLRVLTCSTTLFPEGRKMADVKMPLGDIRVGKNRLSHMMQFSAREVLGAHVDERVIILYKREHTAYVAVFRSASASIPLHSTEFFSFHFSLTARFNDMMY